MTSKVQLNNKVHNATAAGVQGSCRDASGRWAETQCGTRNRKTRASYVAADREVNCAKCLG